MQCVYNYHCDQNNEHMYYSQMFPVASKVLSVTTFFKVVVKCIFLKKENIQYQRVIAICFTGGHKGSLSPFPITYSSTAADLGCLDDWVVRASSLNGTTHLFSCCLKVGVTAICN